MVDKPLSDYPPGWEWLRKVFAEPGYSEVEAERAARNAAEFNRALIDACERDIDVIASRKQAKGRGE